MGGTLNPADSAKQLLLFEGDAFETGQSGIDFPVGGFKPFASQVKVRRVDFAPQETATGQNASYGSAPGTQKWIKDQIAGITAT